MHGNNNTAHKGINTGQTPGSCVGNTSLPLVLRLQYSAALVGII